MNEREYRRLRREIEEDFRKKTEALDLVWQMAKPSASGESVSAGGRWSKGMVLDEIRSVLKEMQETFGAKTVMEKVQERNPELATLKRASFSSALRRLADEHEIELVTLGAGKRGSVYRVAKMPTS